MQENVVITDHKKLMNIDPESPSEATVSATKREKKHTQLALSLSKITARAPSQPQSTILQLWH